MNAGEWLYYPLLPPAHGLPVAATAAPETVMAKGVAHQFLQNQLQTWNVETIGVG